MDPRESFYTPVKVFLVETKNPHRTRHFPSLVCTAPFLFTLNPEGGDQILAALQGHIEMGWDPESGWVRRGCQVMLATTLHREVLIKIGGVPKTQESHQHGYLEILSHPGRSAMLGEDSLDEEPRPILADLLIEKMGETTWVYAPVQIRFHQTRPCPTRVEVKKVNQEWAELP